MGNEKAATSSCNRRRQIRYSCIAFILTLGVVSTYWPGLRVGFNVANESKDLKDSTTSQDNVSQPLASDTHTVPPTEESYQKVEKVDVDPSFDERTRLAAMKHLSAQRALYEAAGDEFDFAFRGIGWLYHNLNLTLSAQVPPNKSLAMNADGTDTEIRIFDVNGQHCNPSLLSMWVRVAGPEIFAGAPIPLSSTVGLCEWRFPVNIRYPGQYILEVKLLNHNGLADFNNEKCEMTSELVTNLNETYANHTSIRGFKFYDANLGCCEICTRTLGCVKWSQPALEEGKNCELYFDSTLTEAERESNDTRTNVYDKNEGTSTLQATRRRQSLSTLSFGRESDNFHGAEEVNTLSGQRRLNDPPGQGVSRNEQTSYFLGCGWSFWLTLHRKCITMGDDMIHGSNSTFVYPLTDSNTVDIKTNEDDVERQEHSFRNPRLELTPQLVQAGLPLCTVEDESLNDDSRRQGRWIRYPFPNRSECPFDMGKDPVWSNKCPIIRSDPDRPNCWHRENVAQMGEECVEMNCRFVLTSMWRSWLHEEKQWYGMWQPDRCRYLEFTRHELQQCVTSNRIESMTVNGASLAEFIQQYVEQRLENITFFSPEENTTTIKVSLDTLRLPHLLWHLSNDQYEKALQQTQMASNEEHKYFVTGFFYSSEREPHVTMDRALMFSRIAENILVGDKGYRQINAFDPSAAWTYDSAGQLDGMHIFGPSMKTIVTKWFHHICASPSTSISHLVL